MPVKRTNLSIAWLLALSLSACGDDSKSSDSDAGSDAGAPAEDAGASAKDAATDKPAPDAAGDEPEADGGAGEQGSSDASSAADDASAEHDAGHDAGEADAGPAPELTCASYCSLITSHCTGGNAQYVSEKNCLDSCVFFNDGALGDTSGNTLGCRIYHAVAAAKSPVVHCPHAGITGGDYDPTDGNGSACGDACEGYCDVAWGVCTDNVFASGPQDCQPACRALKKGAHPYTTADSSGDTFNCDVYEISRAASGEIACRDILAGSANCK